MHLKKALPVGDQAHEDWIADLDMLGADAPLPLLRAHLKRAPKPNSYEAGLLNGFLLGRETLSTARAVENTGVVRIAISRTGAADFSLLAQKDLVLRGWEGVETRLLEAGETSEDYGDPDGFRRVRVLNLSRLSRGRDVFRFSNSKFRDSPVLIETIERLGAAANTSLEEWKIVEIPGDIGWEIVSGEYGEFIAELHRTWD